MAGVQNHATAPGAPALKLGTAFTTGPEGPMIVSVIPRAGGTAAMQHVSEQSHTIVMSEVSIKPRLRAFLRSPQATLVPCA